MTILLRITVFCIFVACLVLPVASLQAAFVDEEVEAAVENGESRIPVIVTLKSNSTFDAALAGNLSRQKRIETLQARSAESFQTFAATASFRSGSIRNLRRYWIVNAVAFEASAADIDALASNPQVKSIEYDTPVFLDPSKDVDGRAE
jgi:hypothetical protein